MEQRTVLFDSNHRNQSNNNATTTICKCILILLLCIFIVDQLCLIFRGRWVIRQAVAKAIAAIVSGRAVQRTSNSMKNESQTVEHHVRDIEVGGLVRIGYAKQVRFTKATQVIEPATGSDSGSEDSWIEVGGEKD